MSITLTRRALGGLLLASAALPSVAWSGTASYALPHLLVGAGELVALTRSFGHRWPRHDGMVLIDVRPAEAFAEGHIPGARHIEPDAVAATNGPIAGALRPEAEILALLRRCGVASDRRVVFYDANGGFHASRMLWLLEYLGHQNVAVLNGGLDAFVVAGGDLIQGRGGHGRGTFVPAIMPRRHATADYILAHRDDPETVVVDVRPPPLFADGHIPWAISVPWSANLGEDGLFLPADALGEHFASHGVTPQRNVVIHCQSGLASAHSYLALRLLGYPRVRVYHRSWAEWGADPTLPRATGA